VLEKKEEKSETEQKPTSPDIKEEKSDQQKPTVLEKSETEQKPMVLEKQELEQHIILDSIREAESTEAENYRNPLSAKAQMGYQPPLSQSKEKHPGGDSSSTSKEKSPGDSPLQISTNVGNTEQKSEVPPQQQGEQPPSVLTPERKESSVQTTSKIKLVEPLPKQVGFCSACFTGEYPLDIEDIDYICGLDF